MFGVPGLQDHPKSPLYKACEKGDVEKVRQLLASGELMYTFSLVCERLHMRTLLCANSKNTVCTETNLAICMHVYKGANIYEPGEVGYMPLHIAAFKGQTAVVEELLKHPSKWWVCCCGRVCAYVWFAYSLEHP